MLFSIIIGLTSSLVLTHLIRLLAIFDGVGIFKPLVMFFSLFTSITIAPTIYRQGGGKHGKIFAALLISAFEYTGILSMPEALESRADAEILALVGVQAFSCMVLVPFFFFCLIAIYFSPCRNARPAPRIPSRRVSVLASMAAPRVLVPLAVVLGLCRFASANSNEDELLGTIVDVLADSLKVAAMGLASITTTKQALLAHDFAWQWRSFLVPLVPQFLVYIFVYLLSDTLTEPLWSLLIFDPLEAGTCGWAYVYAYLYYIEQQGSAEEDEVEVDVVATASGQDEHHSPRAL